MLRLYSDNILMLEFLLWDVIVKESKLIEENNKLDKELENLKEKDKEF